MIRSSAMTTGHSRRTLLLGGIAGAGIACLSRAGERGSGRDELFGISLAQWSLHRALQGGALDPLDFPRHAREVFGIDAVEYVSTFYPGKAVDFDYLGRLRRRCEDASVRSLLIMIDGEGDLGHADDDERRRAVERHFKWVAAARFLGCHAIRVNARGTGTREEQAARAAESLHRLGTVADDYGIDVIVENHGGLSSNGDWLAEVMRRADHPRVGTLPDFGNFRIAEGEWYDRYEGVRELMPFARAVSAKSHDFDDDGYERHTDYRKMLRIVLDAGYRGYVGIEYEGGELDEADGIRRTKALLERVRAELAPEYE